MASEIRKNISGWTVDTLHAHIERMLNDHDRMWIELRQADDRRYEQRFDAQEKATGVAIESARQATSKAETAIERRLENTNEWRQAMNDRDLKLLPRLEYDRAHVDLVQRVDELRDVTDKRLSDLAATQIRREAVGVGMNQIWGYIVLAIGLVVGLITVFMWLSSLRPSIERNSEFRKQAEPIIQQH